MREAARELGVAVKSVSKWRRRFADRRLAGLDRRCADRAAEGGVVLAEAERAQLVRWARRAKTAQYLAKPPGLSPCACAGGRDEQAGRRRSWGG